MPPETSPPQPGEPAPAHESSPEVGPAPRRNRSMLLVVAVALIVGLLYWSPWSDGADRLQADEVGEDPWLDIAGPQADDLNQVLDEIGDAVRDLSVDDDHAAAQQTAADAARDLGLAVDDPPSPVGVALYGGSGENICDTEQLINFLAEDKEAAAAWAKVQRIEPTQIPAYIASLRAGYLLVDTAVTNHGLRDGLANPIPGTILEAGSAVLVDADGVPRVRCKCGNPLLPDRTVLGDNVLSGTQLSMPFPAELTLQVPAASDQRFFPLGYPGNVVVRLTPGEAGGHNSTVPTDSGIGLRMHTVEVLFDGTRSVPIGDIALPETYPAELLAAQSDGLMAVGTLEQEQLSLPIAGIPVGTICHRDDDESIIVGGWQFNGEPATLAGEFVVDMTGGEITDYQVTIWLEAPAERILLTGSDGLNLTRCLQTMPASVEWTSSI